MLETPVTSSPLVANYLSNLPVYRTGIAPLQRGVEIGLAHGFLLVGPFIKVRGVAFEIAVSDAPQLNVFKPLYFATTPTQPRSFQALGTSPDDVLCSRAYYLGLPIIFWSIAQLKVERNVYCIGVNRCCR